MKTAKPIYARRTWTRGVAAGVGSLWLPRALGCAPAEEEDDDEDDEYRSIVADGRPDHEVGMFPNPGCPFPIREQERVYRVRTHPTPAPELVPIGYVEMGIAQNGVPFDPAGPPYVRDGVVDPDWQFEVTSPIARPHLGLDMQHAHTQPSGAYHYHGFAPALAAQAGSGASAGQMVLLGWGADGFPIYGAFGHRDADDPESPLVQLTSSYRLRAGDRDGGPGGRHDGTMVQDWVYDPGLGDLDEANGRFGVTPDAPGGTYHYVLTNAFPYIPRWFRGVPDESFAQHAVGPGIAGVPPALRDYRG